MAQSFRVIAALSALGCATTASAQLAKPVFGSPSTATPGKKDCIPPSALRVDGMARPGVHPLGDEPPAKQMLTVLQTIDSCPAPIVIRRGIGEKR